MANHFILSCLLCELKYYSDESLSVVMETKKGKMIGCLLAQLSTATLLSLGDREQRQALAVRVQSVPVQRCGAAGHGQWFTVEPLSKGHSD